MNNGAEKPKIIEEEKNSPHFLLPQVSLRDVVRAQLLEESNDRRERRRRYRAPMKGQHEEKVSKREEFLAEKPTHVGTTVKKHRLLNMLNNKNPRETIEEIRKEVDILLKMDNKAVAADLHSALKKTEVNLDCAAQKQ